ncbi:MAG: hypothetical protein KF802_12500 [Bdellovibrionaceae bacterium]|nr:hypothetical protein [Pseudobdellovibrionaceae bacterium]MBX3034685.1 hypothetical protein [Pseudobdellovibrionaceae bacterium]
MKRVFPPSPEVLRVSEAVLALQGSKERDPRRLAAAVKRLSDFFIAEPEGATPWKEAWAVEAYFSYYLVLNEIRNRAVVLEGRKLGFFDGLDRAVDFGAGPGTADFALAAHAGIQSFSLIDRSEVPGQRLRAAGADPNWRYFSRLEDSLFTSPSSTLFVASYSLTEARIPPQALQCEALMILEPSTQQDGRELLKLRDHLRREGYHLWAPCTHQGACPLLKNSPRDWCHDRVHVDRPEWLVRLENELPFRNQTVTFSYLLARRTPPPPLPEGAARLIGDRLGEKGKDRQMVCRGEEREFLAWMHRQGPAPEWPRGALVQLPEGLKKTSNEIRVDRQLTIL